MEPGTPWCRAVLHRADGSPLATVSIDGPGPPDLAALDLVAGLAQLARRAGGVLVVGEVSVGLVELFELAGLRRQVLGQVEDRKDPFGVEKEGHGGDPAV